MSIKKGLVFVLICSLSLACREDSNRPFIVKHGIDCGEEVVHTFPSKTKHLPVILPIIQAVEKDDKETLAELVIYPLRRKHPLPSIKNKHDFIKKYPLIFNKKLRDIVIESNPISDWKEVGWRGIMLQNGEIWVTGDGRIRDITYESPTERKRREGIISKSKMKLHSSLREFKSPVLTMETKRFRVRIDDMGGSYRYASWGIGKQVGAKPDIVISRGKVEYAGSGGGRVYAFKAGGHLYECDIYAGEGSLSVYKENKLLFQQKSTKFTY